MHRLDAGRRWQNTMGWFPVPMLGATLLVGISSRLPRVEDAIDDLVSAAGEYDLGEIVRRIEHGRPVEGSLAGGDANDIDVVVLGTTARRGMDRILLGSVAEKTVQSAPVPVNTVGGSA